MRNVTAEPRLPADVLPAYVVPGVHEASNSPQLPDNPAPRRATRELKGRLVRKTMPDEAFVSSPAGMGPPGLGGNVMCTGAIGSGSELRASPMPGGTSASHASESLPKPPEPGVPILAAAAAVLGVAVSMSEKRKRDDDSDATEVDTKAALQKTCWGNDDIKDGLDKDDSLRPSSSKARGARDGQKISGMRQQEDTRPQVPLIQEVDATSSQPPRTHMDTAMSIDANEDTDLECDPKPPAHSDSRTVLDDSTEPATVVTEPPAVSTSSPVQPSGSIACANEAGQPRTQEDVLQPRIALAILGYTYDGNEENNAVDFTQCGLKNAGNTCYLNALLFCLAKLRPLALAMAEETN